MSTSNDGMRTNIQATHPTKATEATETEKRLRAPVRVLEQQLRGTEARVRDSEIARETEKKRHEKEVRFRMMHDEEEQHLPLTPVSISSSSDSFVSIPDHLISLAALEHLGYNSETATRIWEYWTNWPPGEPKRETDDTDDGV
ncbi:hypothetical protein PENPOL_c016G08267 [Penicillium polonicum]|uniref:Uncharacterized protein n=1 Tax=Penicillium polonicum TaxID=60169 RepID=A0A1V6N9X8_PENPO|nr:hypothetical protein PENPOL_c016G08267 [Penicillium polonicum]